MGQAAKHIRLSSGTQAVESTEYLGGVLWLDQFVQGPEQEDHKNTESFHRHGLIGRVPCS